MTETTNYKLAKPDYGEDADVAVINGNMDIIDEQLKKVNNKADGIGLVYDPEYHAIELGGGGHSEGGGGGSGGGEGYTPTAAGPDKLGCIKVGPDFTIAEDGTLSINKVDNADISNMLPQSARIQCVDVNPLKTAIAKAPIMQTAQAAVPDNIGDTARYIKDGSDIYHPMEDMTARQMAEENAESIENKVDKVTGKGLSANDFTDEYKRKLDSVEESANNITVDTELNDQSINPVQNKVIKGALDNKLDKEGGTQSIKYDSLSVEIADNFNIVDGSGETKFGVDSDGTVTSVYLNNKFDDKADKDHGHTIEDIDNLNIVLESKAENEHTHSVSDIDGLEEELDQAINQNVFGKIVVGSVTISAGGAEDTLTFEAGENVTLTPDTRDKKVTINAKDTTYKTATQSVEGLLSPEDKTWIDKVSIGYNPAFNVTASGGGSHAEGYGTTATGDYSHAEGSGTRTGDSYSHAEGIESKTGAEGSHAEGYSNTTYGNSSHAEGIHCDATGDFSHAEGAYTDTKGIGSHAEGFHTVAESDYSHAEGEYNILDQRTDTARSLFTIGNGSGEDTRSNAFRVTFDGTCYSKNSFQASGADYAEYFEWLDGNPDNEDRRGLFVTLEGDKIRIAGPEDDYILGVISATPLIAGNAHSETWKDMYMTDIYGQPVTETVEVEEYTDKNGYVFPAHTEVRYIVNPDYKPDEKYISREDRPEWGAVGFMGQLIVRDDGSCNINGYCKPTEGGIATAVDEVSGATDYRVLARLDDTHIKILIK